MLNGMRSWTTAASVVVALMIGAPATAATIGYVESFDSDAAGWEDPVNAPLTWVGSGGADGGGYASTTFNYDGYTSAFGGGPIVFRASYADGPSGLAFAGDYLSEGVGAISVRFRHDAPEPLTLYMRVATQYNFPGAVVAQAVAAPANTWTEVVFTIDPESPLCTGETITCTTAFSAVENLQFGTDAPAGLLDDDFAYTLDIDQVSILPVPEPGTALLMGLGLSGLAVASRREARR